MPKLLIVDDEEDIREFAKNFFKKRNIEVFTAATGHDALAVIESQKPDLVLLDVRMDGMTGLEVLREIRKRNSTIKVAMVTGVEDEATINETKQLGIVGYIHKPLVLEELEAIVLKEISSGGGK